MLHVISVFKYYCGLPCLVIGLEMLLQNNRCSNFAVIEKQGILEAVPSQHLCFQGQEESVKKQKQISREWLSKHPWHVHFPLLICYLLGNLEYLNFGFVVMLFQSIILWPVKTEVLWSKLLCNTSVSTLFTLVSNHFDILWDNVSAIILINNV